MLYFNVDISSPFFGQKVASFSDVGKTAVDRFDISSPRGAIHPQTLQENTSITLGQLYATGPLVEKRDRPSTSKVPSSEQI